MLKSTLAYLRCPRSRCAKKERELRLEIQEERKLANGAEEVVHGALVCPSCRANFPILGGVAIVLDHVGDYLISHVKGISREVPESRFPKAFRKEMVRARRELETGHIEEDLESERVTALYLATHYLRAEGSWWKSGSVSSPEIHELIRKYWDHGPFEKIRAGLTEILGGEKAAFVELGCGAGGLLGVLRPQLRSYLGVDTSFASIALARRLALGVGHQRVRIPGDLIEGPLATEVTPLIPQVPNDHVEADFIVTDAVSPALKSARWDVCASLNMIDMLNDPQALPEIQKRLLSAGAWAIQSSPYVWHPDTAKALRRKLPKDIRDSAAAVRVLYERAGFQIRRSEQHIPWLFFKHARQIELYSVHLLFAQSAQAAK